MRSISKVQLALIISGIAVFVILLFANTQVPAKPAVTEILDASADIEIAIKQSKTTLSETEAASIEALEQGQLFDSLAKTAYILKKPELAAWYYEQDAIKNNTSKNWFTAGNGYYIATRFIKEELRPKFYQKAIQCLEKSFAADNSNLETKTVLGAAYVEGTADPMKGITLLKEVVATDSTYINAHLNLALFSEKSGQFDKAIERFKKVLVIDPAYLEAYLHMADAYERTGNKQAAIESLEKYVSLVDEITIKTEVQNYINKLKNT